MRKEFERVTPESVGIRSKAIMDYIDALERSNTEMHGLMIMRHGKSAPRAGGSRLRPVCAMACNPIQRHMRPQQWASLIPRAFCAWMNG